MHSENTQKTNPLHSLKKKDSFPEEVVENVHIIMFTTAVVVKIGGPMFTFFTVLGKCFEKKLS